MRKEFLEKNVGWDQLFESNNWNKVFLTYKDKWPQQVERVKKILSEDLNKIERTFQRPDSLPEISTAKGETLSGPLDPSAFKGLRGKTRGDYSEGQTKVDSYNWALACLGGSIAGRYSVQRSQGNKCNYFVVFPVPQKIELSNFLEIRESVYAKGLSYLSVQNAAAHFAVLLSEKMMELFFSKSQFSDKFSGIFYFSLVQTGQQFKPSSGGNLSLYPLMELAFSKNPVVADVFKNWDYLFRKGSVKGCEDLGLAITNFIMHPTLESYETHARIFLRYIIEGEVKGENYYSENSLKEVINYAK
ncbi:MAG: hypothetical protein H5U06_11065 [Candidatus Aminicenantes bacterium]|nr:hypothetical protein [Candidatus Aminicenantes bacterium]